MLFEYNSSPAIGAAAINIDDHASNLLHHLSMRRKGASRRPIVFVSHSLGGLVVKQALVLAMLNPSYKRILKSTTLLAFFGTPHRGGNFANVGNTAASIVRKLIGNPRNDLVKGLKKHLDMATKRCEEFRHLSDRFTILSFWETHPYGRLGLIVDKESATMGLPQEVQLAVNGDHSSICKFASAHDIDCEVVLATIASNIVDALMIQEASRSVRRYMPPAMRRLFVRRLKVPKTVQKATATSFETKTTMAERLKVEELVHQNESEIRPRLSDVSRMSRLSLAPSRHSLIKDSRSARNSSETLRAVPHVVDKGHQVEERPVRQPSRGSIPLVEKSEKQQGKVSCEGVNKISDKGVCTSEPAEGQLETKWASGWISQIFSMDNRTASAH